MWRYNLVFCAYFMRRFLMLLNGPFTTTVLSIVSMVCGWRRSARTAGSKRSWSTTSVYLMRYVMIELSPIGLVVDGVVGGGVDGGCITGAEIGSVSGGGGGFSLSVPMSASKSGFSTSTSTSDKPPS